jgi:ribosomal protein S18 acetylase RimI-like enzyme
LSKRLSCSNEAIDDVVMRRDSGNVHLLGTAELATREQAIGSLIRRAVADGAALGWVDPPSSTQTNELLGDLAQEITDGDAAAVVAETTESRLQSRVLGFGYWRRYQRETHRQNADLPLLVVDASARRQGLASSMLIELTVAAQMASLEQLTLDARGDNLGAHQLWRTQGFQQYGRLRDFVAVGDQRYDKTLWVLNLRR